MLGPHSDHLFTERGAGIAQRLLERRISDWKVADSSPGRSGGRLFLSRVNFLCWLFFRYPFHPRVTAVTRNNCLSAKSAGGRLQLNMHTPWVCSFAWSDMVHGCIVYTERTETAAVSCGTSHVSAVSTPLRWILKTRYEHLVTHAEPHVTAVSRLKSG